MLTKNYKRLPHITLGHGHANLTNPQNIYMPDTNLIHRQKTITLNTLMSPVVRTRDTRPTFTLPLKSSRTPAYRVMLDKTGKQKGQYVDVVPIQLVDDFDGT